MLSYEVYGDILSLNPPRCPPGTRMSFLASGPYSRFMNELPKLNRGPRSDFVLVPYALNVAPAAASGAVEDFLDGICRRLPRYRQEPGRHVFFLVGDDSRDWKALAGSIVFQHSCLFSSRAKALHYSVPWLGEARGIETATLDAAFRGNLRAHAVRGELSRMPFERLKVSLRWNSRYYQRFGPAKRWWLARRWREEMESAKFVLCPRGVGLSSIRIYEALRSGRVPVIIADGLKLPLERQIDWPSISLRIPEADLASLEIRLADFMRRDMAEVSRAAQRIYYEFFSDHALENFLRSSLRE